LRGLLPAGAICPGERAARNSYWLFPILAPRRERLIRRLRARGFDASGPHSLCVVDSPRHRDTPSPRVARWVYDNLAFLPLEPSMSHATLRRLAGVVTEHLDDAPPLTAPARAVPVAV